jgi:hypothetical protein
VMNGLTAAHDRRAAVRAVFGDPPHDVLTQSSKIS